MEEASRILILLGSIFMVSLIVSPLSRRLNIPRVTLLIVSGIALGPYGADFINGIERSWFPIIADITLLIIGYLLGARLTRSYLERYATGVLISSLIITLTTTGIVTLGLLLLGFSLEVSLVLGALAAATDPAATLDVLKQHNQGSHFGSVLEGIVAMDDILGLLVFSFLLAAIGIINGHGNNETHLLHFVWDIGGATLLGIGMGGLTAYLLDKKPEEHPVIVESLGFIFLCGGIAMLMEVSFLLAAMVMGIVVVNRANKTCDHLHEIEFIEQPFLVLFFIMAGATLQLENASMIGYVGIAFIVLRILGRYLGGLSVPSRFIYNNEKRWIGLALLPQAGVAMGMALVASSAYPAIADIVLPVTITATVIFELTGPILTHLALSKIEAHNKPGVNE